MNIHTEHPKDGYWLRGGDGMVYHVIITERGQLYFNGILQTNHP